jgi:hypothetical protein
MDWGPNRTLCYQSNKLYVVWTLKPPAGVRTGLEIYDVTTLGSPSRLSRLEFTTQPMANETSERAGCAISGDGSTLYIGHVNALTQFQAINVTNGTAPVRGSLFTNQSGFNYGQDMTVVGSHLYIVDLWGFEIWNLATPLTPTYVGRYTCPSGVLSSAQVSKGGRAFGIAISGTPGSAGAKAYLTVNRGTGGGGFTYRSSLNVVDLSTIATPTSLGNSAERPGRFQGVAVGPSNNIAVSDRHYGLVNFDVSTPASPTYQGDFRTAGEGNEAWLDTRGTRDYLLIGDFVSGGFEYDISDKENPIYLGAWNTGANGNKSIFQKGNRVFLFQDGGYTHVYNWGASGGLTLINDAMEPAGVTGYWWDGTRYLYLAKSRMGADANTNCFFIIDLQDETNPVYLGTLTNAQVPSYNPTDPIRIGNRCYYDTPASGGAIGRRVVLNVSNLSAPTVVSNSLLPAYSTTGNNLGWNPAAIGPTGYYFTYEHDPKGGAIVNGVQLGARLIRTWDISGANADAPLLAATKTLNDDPYPKDTKRIWWENDILYISRYQANILAFDTTNPLSLVQLGSYTPGVGNVFSYKARIQDGFAFVPLLGGFWIVKVPE